MNDTSAIIADITESVQSGDLTGAEEMALGALQSHPDDSGILYTLGFIQHQRGLKDEAAETYEKAIESDPLHVASWTNLGMLYGDMDQPGKANNCFVKIVEASEHIPIEDMQGQVYVANAHKILGNQHERISIYRRLTVAFPDDLSLLNILGGLELDARRLDDSIATFIILLDKIPPDQMEIRKQVQGFIDAAKTKKIENAQFDFATRKEFLSELTSWEEQNRTPTQSNRTQEFWKSRNAAEALSHTFWDIFAQSAMYHFALKNDAKEPAELYTDGVMAMGVLPDEQLAKMRAAFEDCPAEEIDVDDTSAFQSFDPLEVHSATRNKSSIMRRVSQELCDVVAECLRPHLDTLDRLMGHHWHVPQIWAHSYRDFDNPDIDGLSASVWHQDGCPSSMKKIFFYLDGASEEIGATAFRTRRGKEFVFEGEPGVWALFEPAIALHRAMPPVNTPRPVVEIQITPAFDTDPRPIRHGMNCGYPWFPLETGEQDENLPPNYTTSAVRDRTLQRWFRLMEDMADVRTDKYRSSPYKIL